MGRLSASQTGLSKNNLRGSALPKMLNPLRTHAMRDDVIKDKSLESWIWDAACSIRGAKDAPKYKDYILPLIFAKRLCDVFDDEVNRIAKEVGGRAKAFKLIESDWRKATASKSKPMVRFYLPLKPENPDEPV